MYLITRRTHGLNVYFIVQIRVVEIKKQGNVMVLELRDLYYIWKIINQWNKANKYLNIDIFEIRELINR